MLIAFLTMLSTPFLLSAFLLSYASAAVTPSNLATGDFVLERATPPCNITAVSPPPSGAICNKQGFLKKPPATPLSGPTSSSQTNCRDSCVTNSACASFGFNTASKQCTLYNKALSAYGFTASKSNNVYSGKGCYKQTCLQCNSPQAYCSGQTCSNLNTDPNNCGSCGTTCTGGRTCSGGTCKCPSGQTFCKASNTCVSLQNDSSNCGKCGTTCPTNSKCLKGSCVCNGSLTACNGSCLNLQNNNANCGTCGNACASGQICSAGTCKCSSGSLNDNNNCGSCGNVCGNGETCLNGQCACSDGTTPDFSSDNNNCGGCNNVCSSGLTCQSGSCSCSISSSCGSCGNVCTGNSVCCGGSCVDPTADPSNCGACGNTCAAGQTCSAGSCLTQGPAYLYGVTQGGSILPVLIEPTDYRFFRIGSPGSYGDMQYTYDYEPVPYSLDSNTTYVTFQTSSSSTLLAMTTVFDGQTDNPNVRSVAQLSPYVPLTCQLVPYSGADQELKCSLNYDGVFLSVFSSQYRGGWLFFSDGSNDPNAAPIRIISSTKQYV